MPIFLFSLITIHVVEVFGCGGGGGGGGGGWKKNVKKPEETTTEDTLDKFEKDDLKRNLPGVWGGFEPPKELEETWRTWLNDYKALREMENEESDEKYKKFRGPGSGWPPNWHGIGGGFDGAEAPPWAYRPSNTGLPAFCYQEPKRGTCNKKLKRWAFNPYTAECSEFDYSGCGENQNNFVERLRCEEACMKAPAGGCDPDTQQYIEDLKD